MPVYSLLLVCVLSLQVHTRPRVQRATGIPHALKGGERFINGSGALRGEAANACVRLSKMASFHARRFNESSLRTQGPIPRGLSFRHRSRGLFSLLRPGAMGPCVRRDDERVECSPPTFGSP